MSNTIKTAKLVLNESYKFSSSIPKTGTFSIDGRSVSIFSINTDDCKSMISSY